MAVYKVELPLIDGMDPVGWITRVETYFKVQITLDDVEVKLAKLSMEGATIYLFNLLKETKEDALCCIHEEGEFLVLISSPICEQGKEL